MLKSGKQAQSQDRRANQMMNSGKTFGLPALLLGSAMGLSAFAQTSTPAAQTTDSTVATSTTGTAAATNADGTYATGKPLTDQSKEGFWGHMNPFARKKWVNRQTAP